MSVSQIPNLTPATSLNGNEQLEAVQSGSSVRLTTAQIGAYVATTYPAPGISSVTANSPLSSSTVSGAVTITLPTAAITNTYLGQMAAGTVKANLTGGTASPSDVTPSAILNTFGTAVGSMLYRGASAWQALGIGTNGQILTSNGTSPYWATLSIPSGTIAPTGVTAGTYGSASSVAQFTVLASGQLSAASNVSISIPYTQVTGLGTMATQNATSVAIYGGAIDNTAIGGTTPATGVFSTLTASNSNLGTVQSGVWHGSPVPTQYGGTGASTLTGYVKGTGIAALTAVASIPSSDISGLGSMATQSASSVAITGGTINGVTIGGSTPGPATITNLTVTGSFAPGTISSGTWQGTPIAVAYGGTGATTASGARANLGAAASGANSDITSLSGLTTPLSETQGGTGYGSYTTGDILYAASSMTLARLNDVATGNALISGGVGAAPSWGKIGLATHVSGTLPTANGGTGLTSFTSGGAVYATSTSALTTGTLPASAGGTGVTSLGTGVAAALGNAVTGSGSIVLATSPTLITPALGTPASGVMTNVTGLPLTSGVTGTLPVANGGTGITSFGTGVAGALGNAVTGTGGIVLATSPTLVTPALGTPASGVMTNVTGLPLTTGVTGTLGVTNGGTGVTTSTGSGSNVLSTSPTLVTPILGTPTSVTLTNATGLPLTSGVTGTLPVANGGTGITSFGTGVAAALGNAVTGSGGIVLATSPTLVTPVLGTPASGVMTNVTGLPLTSGVTGTLPVGNGGTGATTLTGYLVGNGTGAVTAVSTIPNAGLTNSSITIGSTTISLGGTSTTLGGLTTVTLTQDPTAALQVTTKQYVDGQISTVSNTTFHASSGYSTTADLGTVTYNNGTSGVGATITNAGTQAALTIDGYTFTATDVSNSVRVLVKNQSSGLQNGIYTVTNQGSVSTNWVLTRATDFNTVGTGPNYIETGASTFVSAGAVNAASSWVMNTSGSITVGSTALVWAQTSSASSVTVASPLTKVGSVISLGTVPINLGGTNLTSYTQYGLLYAPTTGSLGQIATGTSGYALVSGGAGAAPSFAQISLTAGVTGTLPVANGGTGVTTSTGSGNNVLSTSPTLVTPVLGTPTSVTLTNATGLPLSTGVTGTLPVANGGTGQTTYTDGQLLIGSTTGGTLAKSTLTAGTAISVTNGSGSITIANTGVTSAVAGTGISVSSATGAVTITNSGVTSISFGTTGLTPSTTTTGAVTVAGTLAVANGGTGVTTSTGSGNNVLSTSPTLVTPILGTPTSVTLTNATGLPLTTGVTGTLPIGNGGTGITSLGTGVQTALGVAVTGSGGIVLATSPTLVTPALGTPSAAVLTNATGLPLTSGVTGTLPVGNGGTGTATAFTTGSVVFAGASGVYSQNNSKLFWDNTNNRLGINTASPQTQLTVVSNTQTTTPTGTLPAGTDVYIVGANAANTRITQDAYGTGSYGVYTARSARGTAASPTASQSGDFLSQFTARGYGTTGFGTASTGYLAISAAENFTDTAQGTYASIFTTATGGNSATEAFRFGPAGQFGIGAGTYGTAGYFLTSGGASAAPTWSQVSATSLSGTVPVTSGGTGLTSYTTGSLLYASGTTTLAGLADVATGNVLLSGGVGVAPSWGQVSLTTAVTGTLPVANGGSGATTLTGYLKGNGTSAFTAVSSIPSTDITGLGTMSTQNASSVAITGGTITGVTINNSTIGATTAAAGTFTTVNATTYASGAWNGTAIGATYGGTGQTTVTTGDLLYGSASNTWGKLADVATGSVLVSGGVGVAPAWSATPTLTSLTSPIHYGGTAASSTLTLQSTSGVGTTDSILFKVGNNGATTAMSIASGGTVTIGTLNLTNALGTAYGGTGLTTFLGANLALYSTGASTLAAGTLPVLAGGTGQFTAPSNGQLLIGNGTTYTLATLTAGTNIAVTNGAGSISIATSATPSFATSVTTPLVIGGTTASSTLTLQSTSGAGTSDAMIFQTGSQSERMRIDTSGNVGIGTASPSAKLHVSGTGSTTSRITVESSATSGSSLPSIYLNRTSTASMPAQFQGSLIWQTTLTDSTLITSSIGSTGSNVAGSSAMNLAYNAVTTHQFQISGTEYMRLNATGLGIGVSPSAALSVSGSITATGSITAYFSDDRLKTRKGNIQDALAKVEKLNGFHYEANEVAQGLGYEARPEVGVSAQEVQAIMPEVVVPAPIDEKYLTIHYERMVPLLIEAIKELSAKVKELENKQCQ